MARAQKLLTPVRLFGDYSDLTDQSWTLTVNRSGFIIPTRTVTAGSHSLTEADNVIFANAAGGGVTVDVYNTSSNAGAMVTIKKIDTTNNIVTITTEGGDSIDGQSEFYLQAPYDSVTLVSDGSNWYVI